MKIVSLNATTITARRMLLSTSTSSSSSHHHHLTPFAHLQDHNSHHHLNNPHQQQQPSWMKKKKTLVIKFGGSSVGNAMAIHSTAQVLASASSSPSPSSSKCRVVGVVSAMYGVTNELVACVDAASRANWKLIKEKKHKIWNLHEETCKKLLSKNGSEKVLKDIERYFSIHFDPVLEEIARNGGASDAWQMDRVSSLGERFSTRILARHLSEIGVATLGLQADEGVIATNGVPGDSSADLIQTRKNVENLIVPALDDGKVVVVTGFFGQGPDGRTTTFGRGGSDVSATVLGNALRADEVVLMKVECSADSNGHMKGWLPGWVGVVHDADPTHTVGELTYKEAAELAFWGKKVLHAHTTSYVENEGIPIRVASSFEPSHQGTLIGVAPSASRLKAFTALDLKQLVNKLDNKQISMMMVATEERGKEIAMRKTKKSEETGDRLLSWMAKQPTRTPLPPIAVQDETFPFSFLPSDAFGKKDNVFDLERASSSQIIIGSSGSSGSSNSSSNNGSSSTGSNVTAAVVSQRQLSTSASSSSSSSRSAFSFISRLSTLFPHFPFCSLSSPAKELPDDLCAIACVGHQVGQGDHSTRAILFSVSAVLEAGGIVSAALGTMRGSEHCVSVVVDAKEKKKALKLLYDRFVVQGGGKFN